MNVVILANLIAVVSLIISSISWWKKTKEKVLKLQIMSNIISIIQYTLLIPYGGLSGILIKMVAIFRDILNIKKEKYKILNSKKVLFVLLLIYFIIGMITYNNIISIFSVLAAVSYTIIMWPNNIKLVRIAAVVSSIFWIIYNVYIQAYIQSLSNTIILISSLFALINGIKKEDKNKET